MNYELIKNNLNYSINNGYYVIPLFFGINYISNNYFLSLIICLKIFPVNYYYWFGDYYDYKINKKYNILKPFVRFTDSGHVVNLLYYLYPEKYLSLAFNVHFMITFGYWSTVMLLNMKDADCIKVEGVDEKLMNMWVLMNHGFVFLHYILFIVSNNNDVELFTEDDLMITFYWLYIWFIFIWFPWYMCTGDPVYSVLGKDSSIFVKISTVLLMHSLLYLSNNIGFYISINTIKNSSFSDSNFS